MKLKRQWINIIALASLLAIVTPAGASLLAQEIDLNPTGMAYELNPDSQGHLWISDASAWEVWRINPVNGAYTVYPMAGGPSDARSDNNGHVWWADFTINQLGRLTQSNNTVDVWEIPDSAGLYTTAIDAEGDIWVTDFSDSRLYELDPDPGQGNFCVYPLPDTGWGSYMTVSGQDLWLGDYFNGRLLRVNTTDAASHTFTWWQLSPISSPEGIAVDGAGNVWWTDIVLDIVGRLDPDGLAYTTFNPPGVQIPFMLSLHGDQVWVSLQGTGGIGLLDPATAVGQTHTATSGSLVVTPECSSLNASLHDTLEPTSGTAAWGDQAYQTAVDQPGWALFDLPDDGLPWGVASLAQVFMVDQGRSKLARLPYPAEVSACKLRDRDGDLGTSNDQTPVAGFPLYLRIAGVRQETARLTGQNGCATWLGLQPGPAYGVEEVEADGWTALAGTVHDFGASASDGSYTHTFINKHTGFIYLPLIVK